MSYWVLLLSPIYKQKVERGIGPRLRAGIGSAKAWEVLQIASGLGEGAVEGQGRPPWGETTQECISDPQGGEVPSEHLNQHSACTEGQTKAQRGGETGLRSHSQNSRP